jgi:hypothetical protein
MTILNLYQAALIVTIAGVALAAHRAKRQMEAEARLVHSAGTEPAPMPAGRPVASNKPMASHRPLTSESLNAVNKLFDDNLISVEEYVELRKRATP